MARRLLHLFLATALVGATPLNAVGQDPGDKAVQKVKEGVARIGTGEESRVRVALKDGSRVEGYVSRIEDQNFVVMERETGRSTSIAYSDVAKLKGKGMSTAAKIAIVAAAGFAAILIWLTAAGFWGD